MCVASFLRNYWLIAVVALFSLSIWGAPAAASMPMDGQLQATQSCPAFQSFRQRTNPSHVRLTRDAIYAIVEKNQPHPTHYRLKIPGANPELRWVAIDCGQFLGDTRPVDPILPEPIAATGPQSSIKPQSPNNLLAVSWQPAFCETHEDKPECQTQTANRFDATNFTLHGLWPQPRGNDYCNVSRTIVQLDQAKQWRALPDIDLPQPLLDELQVKMPGVASNLHLHEWYKHGTCYSATPEEYYRESLALLDQVNNSSVRDLFVNSIDRRIATQNIRDEFRHAFRNGAEYKVSVQCADDRRPRKRRMIQELQLNFKGEIAPDTSVAALFKDGQAVAANCRGGEVDRAGLN